jgi:REP element-mobilizing transposase RayT
MPVAAYHIVLANYGFWLPNDPRGSRSDYVRSWELFVAGGPSTKFNTRRSVPAAHHDHQHRQRAKTALVRPPVVFTGRQAHAIGIGFARFVARSSVSVVACAIMPTHTHLVVLRPPYRAEQVANLLKGAATAELIRRGLHPFADSPYENGRLPTPWARKQWIRFLNRDADIRRVITYVERNPLKDGLPLQHWSFVVPYELAESTRRRLVTPTPLD